MSGQQPPNLCCKNPFSKLHFQEARTAVFQRNLVFQVQALTNYLHAQYVRIAERARANLARSIGLLAHPHCFFCTLDETDPVQ